MRPLVFFTDVHIDRRKVSRRVEARWETIAGKLRWIGDRCRELDAQAALCGGDLCDRWSWDSEDVMGLVDLLKSTFGETPVYSVVGNHDVPGGSLDLLWVSGLGVASAAPGCPLRIPQGAFVDLDGFRVFLGHWGRYGERLEGTSGLEFAEDALNVLASHASVAQDTGDFAIGVRDLEIDPRVDFAFFGDIHAGFPAQEAPNGHTIVGNPGAVYRRTIAERANRPGVFVLWPDGRLDWEPVPCKPPEEAFHLEEYREEKRAEMGIQEARKAVARFRSSDPGEIVAAAAKAGGFSPEAADLLIQEMGAPI